LFGGVDLLVGWLDLDLFDCWCDSPLMVFVLIGYFGVEFDLHVVSGLNLLVVGDN